MSRVFCRFARKFLFCIENNLNINYINNNKVVVLRNTVLTTNVYKMPKRKQEIEVPKKMEEEKKTKAPAKPKKEKPAEKKEKLPASDRPKRNAKIAYKEESGSEPDVEKAAKAVKAPKAAPKIKNKKKESPKKAAKEESLPKKTKKGTLSKKASKEETLQKEEESPPKMEESDLENEKEEEVKPAKIAKKVSKEESLPKKGKKETLSKKAGKGESPPKKEESPPKIEEPDSEHEEEEEVKPAKIPKKSKAKPKKEDAEEKSKKEDAEEKPKNEDAEEKPIKGGKKTANGKAKAAPMNKTSTSYENIDFNKCIQKNELGKASNFKISNWNVDGIRAWIKKGGLDYLQHENPDIFCMQEIKCSLEKLPEEAKEVDGYKVYWSCSKKDGYAGVALYTKTEPISIKYGLGVKEHDEEGRLITAEFEKFFVLSVYVPNSGRGLVTLPKRLEWNKVFRQYVADLDKKKPVIVCGDMNVSHLEIDLANPKSNTKNAGFTKEERDGMTEFLSDGFVDTFRKLYPDKTQAYTFWTYMANCRTKNVGWRLDYFIVSERFMKSVCDNMIRSEVFGSDHCPITLFVNV